MPNVIKKFLFCLDPEKAHHIALASLSFAYKSGLSKVLFPKPASHPCTIMGITFPNKIGLAAGFDKNADYILPLSALGFGFIEIGTVTPKPQMGNPKPRLFRLAEQEAIINRMGFNNKGMEYVAARLAKTKYQGILGINIGKNRDTPNELAVQDYIACFRKLHSYASYITINISSPNTPGLRDLQHEKQLDELLRIMKQEQHAVSRYVPLVLKLSPDLSTQELSVIAQLLLQHQMDGVIATNTSLQRIDVENSPYAHEAGGLSGRPIHLLNTNIVSQLHTLLQNKIPIIAVGGIMDKATANEKWQAGASLLQVYSGLIYRGTSLIEELIDA